MPKRKKSKKISKKQKSEEVKVMGEYFVEEIKDWALDRSGRIMYLLKWYDYPEEDNSWEFDHQLFDCQDIRQKFKLIVNGRHPPKYSWLEFDQFIQCLKSILNVNYNDIAVLNKLSLKKYSLSEMKANKVIEDIKVHIECQFSRLLMNKFEKRNNTERLEANELLKSICINLKIEENFGRICDFFEFVDKRKSIKNKIEIWVKKQNEIIAEKGEGLPITVVNDVDIEIPTLQKYITKYIIDENINSDLDLNELLNESKAVHSCECMNCYEQRHECCSAVIGFSMAYNRKGLLSHSRYTNTIFECNTKCKCDKSCSNRAIQRGRNSRLEIFRTEMSGKGWAVRTLDPIMRGQFITQYTGEIISLSEAEKRPTTYLYDLGSSLDDNENEFTYVVDANQFGNVARFINHSCEPNCRAVFAWIDSYDRLLPLIALFAIKPIRPNDELTYDYGMGLIDIYDNNVIQVTNEDAISTDSGTESSHIERVVTNDSIDSSDEELELRHNRSVLQNRNKRLSYKKISCLCGSKTCRKFLYS